MHELFYQNKVIKFIEFALFTFPSQENYDPLSKYAIALASRGAVYYNGSLDLLFLLLRSLQKIIYSLLYSFLAYIHTILKFFMNIIHNPAKITKYSNY